MQSGHNLTKNLDETLEHYSIQPYIRVWIIYVDIIDSLYVVAIKRFITF